MDDTLIREIVTRSDGVPLFAEELTKAVLDLRSLGAGAVPLTLQDSLMARLDRLGRAKDIAQIASVIGRQFSYALLEAIAGASDIDLRSALARLRESGLIFEAGNDGESSYSFNHSLVQEAAYESLSRSRRQSLHKEIAHHLESQSNATGESEPTVIAHHYSRAGEAEKSFHYWMLAADRSGQRLAFAESVANLTSALAEAERVADPKLRTRLKLDAQLRLGATLAIHKGPQTSEAGSALQEAKALAKEANAGPQLFQATWGLYLNAARNRRLDEVEVLSEELTTISQEIDDKDFKIEALHHRWGTAYFFGQTAKLLEYAEEGIAYYDRDRHHKFSYVFAGHDPGACAYNCRALALGLLGRSRSVRPTLDAGLALATSLQHPLTLAFYLSIAWSLRCILFGIRMAAGSSPNSSRRYRPDTIFRLPTPSDYSRGARPMRCKATSQMRSSKWSRPTKRHLVTDFWVCSPASFWPTRWRAQTATKKRWHWSRGFSKNRVRRNGAPLFPSYGGFVGRWRCDNQLPIRKTQSAFSEPRYALLMNRGPMFFV